MPWLNADSKMYAHPKMRAAGLEAMGLWLMGGTYSADVLTDGHVPDWIVQSWPSGPELAQRLIDAELWEPAPGGYQVLSWAEYQRTKEQVEAERKKARERKAEWREKNGKN